MLTDPLAPRTEGELLEALVQQRERLARLDQDLANAQRTRGETANRVMELQFALLASRGRR